MNIRNVCILAFVLATFPVFAQQSPTSRSKISLPEQVDLGGLVLLASNAVECSLEYDPALLKGSSAAGALVMLRGISEVSPEELWQLTNQILASRGLTLVRAPGARVLSLVKLADASAAAGMTGESGASADPRLQPGFVQEIIRPRYRTAKDLAEALKPFLTKAGGNAAPVGDSGLLLISDLVPRVEEAKKLLTQLDAPREEIAPLVVEPKNIPPAALAAAVLQLSAKRDSISGDKLKGDLIVAPDGRSLLLLAPEETRESWLLLITTLDQREEVVTRDYTPKVFSAKEVANLIEQTVRERIGAPGVPAAGGMPMAGGGAADDRFRIVTDDLTGTLIVTATPTQHEKIIELLDRLDATPQSAARPVRAFPIRNRPVTEVLATLQELVRAGALDSSMGAEVSGLEVGASAAVREAGAQRSSRPDDPSAGNPMPVPVPPVNQPNAQSSSSGSRSAMNRWDSPSGRPGAMQGIASSRSQSVIPGLSLTADQGTNTLIAIAEPRMLAQLELLIRQLDVRQPQVMLEVYLVSLSEQDAMNLGVQLEKIGAFSGNLYQLSSLFGLTTGSAGNRTPTASQGFNGAILNPGDFSAVIKALETISSGSTKSLPRVLVNNNQLALFNFVLQQPYTISNTTSGAGTTTKSSTFQPMQS
jgi:type II secretory pathway component GspD/PulD (secretin)